MYNVKSIWIKFTPSSFNPLKTKRRMLYLKIQLYRAENSFHLGYKNQSFYDVSGTSRCFWRANV